jgi:hypothetical protein
VAETVEQRILEQSMRLPLAGAVTAWASLRLRGAAFFDGIRWPSGEPLDVPLLVGAAGANLRHMPGSTVTKEQFPPAELEVVCGVRCTSVERATFDEVRRIGGGREGAVALDMAIAAGLTSVATMAAYLETRYAWTGVPLARRSLALAVDDSRSPQESRMRLVWVIDAELPPPLCNCPVFSGDGRLLGYPDLFDPIVGVVGEYDGADHLRRDRRRNDIVREQRYRDHGLEYFTVVRGDLSDRGEVVRRMRAARQRALRRPAGNRLWTLDAPLWYRERRSA